MATQKPLSTISYNSEAFLKEKLDAWVKAHIIQAYQYICHKGEDGDKDHIHLRIEPNKKLDPMTLQEELREFVMGNNKPLGVRPFRPSKEEDWFLYATHDATYLKMKYGGGEKGEKLPYSWEDIKASEFYDVEVAFIRAKAYLEHSSVNMAAKLQNGISPMELIGTGENVYVVNALMRALASSDYQRVSNELSTTKQELLEVYSAIEEYGLVVLLDENGRMYLEKAPEQVDQDNPFV